MSNIPSNPPESFKKRNRHLYPEPLVHLDELERTGKAVDREGDLHDDVEKLCLSEGWLYRHDRMDKPTTGQVGWPDFTIFFPGRKALFLELKAKDTKTTTKQLEKLAHARKFGFVAGIADNMDDVMLLIQQAKDQE